MTERPYGTWPSPLSPHLVAGHDSRPGWIATLGDQQWWSVGLPTEGGRVALLRESADGTVETVLPAPWSVRSSVIEYGGRPWDVAPGTDGPTVVFAHWDDQRLYHYRPGIDAAPRPLTPEPGLPRGLRYADPFLMAGGTEVWCLRENHHSAEPTDVSRDLVAVPCSGAAATDPAAVRVLAASHHFLSGPRVSPSGRRLAWIGWDHPAMPWDSTWLCVADVSGDSAGAPVPHRVLAGGPDESIVGVEWLDEATLVFISDATGWWNLHRIGWDGGGRVNLTPREEEFGGAPWQIGVRWMLPLPDGRIATIHGRSSTRLSILDPGTGVLAPVDSPHTEWSARLSVHGDTLLALGGQATKPFALVRVDLRGPAGSGRPAAKVIESAMRGPCAAAWLPAPRFITVPLGPGGGEIFAQVYPPTNPEHSGPGGEQPPYLVSVHGGPTGRSLAVYDLEVAFFTSRGIGVVEVNYGGSTGHGRDYRNRLRGGWGVVDVEDCAAVARALIAEGTAHPDRIAIRGGSAGGWTVAASLTGTSIYQCGVIYYPILDLVGWRTGETHDFESQYLDSLVGPWPAARQVYEQRSPINHPDRWRTPFLLFQGEADPICPPVQSERLLRRLAGRGVPHAYRSFEGEGHGFRRASTTVACLSAELSFYGQVFGFATPEVPAIELVT
jgi:dipeptidyl aminopeptidase/acylaminoacyl peptidase